MLTNLSSADGPPIGILISSLCNSCGALSRAWCPCGNAIGPANAPNGPASAPNDGTGCCGAPGICWAWICCYKWKKNKLIIFLFQIRIWDE